IFRSWSIDCVLISSVFWRNRIVGSLLAHFRTLQAGSFGDGYSPTPMLTTRTSCRAKLSDSVASAMAYRVGLFATKPPSRTSMRSPRAVVTNFFLKNGYAEQELTTASPIVQ